MTRPQELVKLDIDGYVELLANDPYIVKEYEKSDYYKGATDPADLYGYVYDTYHYEIEEYIDDFFNELGKTYLKKVGKKEYFKITATNIDWQGRSAFKYCHVELNDVDSYNPNFGRYIFAQCFSANTDYDVEFYKGNNCMYIKVYHHDCPTGSLFKLTPATKGKYDSFR